MAEEEEEGRTNVVDEEEAEKELFEYRVAKLITMYDDMVSKPKPKVGDVVMANQSLSTCDMLILCFTPGIVSKVYDEPIYCSRNKNPDVDSFDDPLDTVVFTYDRGHFVELHVNSMRLNVVEDTKPFEKPRHTFVICDGCRKQEFEGKRYVCKVCTDYDLCEDCYRSPESLPPGPHNPKTHEMQEIRPLTIGFLREMFEKFTAERAPFRPGDIVRWKEGLKNKTLPEKDGVAVVMEVLPAVYEPLDSGTHLGSRYFHEPCDCKLGVVGAGKFMIFHYDSRRFELVKRKEEKEEEKN